MEAVTARRKFGLRAQLLLLSIAVLAVPYAGVEYVRELERYLRESFSASLSDAARAVAGPLHNQPQLFPFSPAASERTLYVHRLRHPIQLDGYTDDWSDYLGWAESFFGSNPKSGFRLIVGRYQANYHLLLQVRDEHLVWQRADQPDALDNDHVVLVLGDNYGNPVRYHFAPTGPGSLRPFTFHFTQDEFRFEHRSTEFITNIRGELQQTADGFNLEVTLPASMVHERLGVEWVDVDDEITRRAHVVVSTSGPGVLERPGQLVQASTQLVQLIERFADVPGRRVWVLDERGRVLASAGSLEKPQAGKPPGLLYRWLLPPIPESFADDLAGSSRLHGAEVEHALAGAVAARWRSSPDGLAIIVSAAAPVLNGNAVQGAVVVEESTGTLLVLQRDAMISLFNKTLLVFVVLTTLALAFATRLSLRLRRLSDAAEAAIDAHGRVIAGFMPSSAADEIGDLSRTFGALLTRLQEYHRYLESLAGRLSHELRTPIAVVRSSLEHVAVAASPAEQAPYLQRAREGIERLTLLVTRLSEAARLDLALQQARSQPLEVKEFVGRCVAGYGMAFGNVEFQDRSGPEPILHPIAPDLFEQMLDKLIANAADFRLPGTPIVVGLAADAMSWTLTVANQGPVLPESMQGQLFNSMVSVRPDSGAREPHLGLGLYIVRLIAEFHRARVAAANLPEQRGVCFSLTFTRDPPGRPAVHTSA
jgi:dedicated sortase system histidine kinase